MSRVYHTADWHLGHKAILKYRPQFTSVEEHNDTIINNYLATIRPRDTVYFHGDIIFDEQYLETVKALPGNKILILGNHCTDFLKTEDYIGVFQRIVSLTTKKHAWLSHAPIHPAELRGKFNIHGHVHAQTLSDCRYYNVSLENTDYYPISREEINQFFKENNNE